MSKVTINLTPDQILQAVDQLPEKEQVKISDKLQDTTARLKVRAILRRIDSYKGRRPSTREILKEIHNYRKEKNA